MRIGVGCCIGFVTSFVGFWLYIWLVVHLDVDLQPPVAKVTTARSTDHEEAAADEVPISLGELYSQENTIAAQSRGDLQAWVYVGTLDRKHGFYYFPVVATLMEGLESHGVQVHECYMTDLNSMGNELKRAVAAERKAVPVVISLHWDKRWFGQKKYLASLRRVAALGAYLVLYQLEPREAVYGTAVATAREVGAREIWDYSRGVLSMYEHDGTDIIKRFVPPGCAQRLDVGVRLDAHAREESYIGFLGQWEARDPDFRDSLNRSAAGRIALGSPSSAVNSFGVKDDSQWREYLERYPLQLNLHSSWNEVAAFESLRAAMLLTNSACLLSLPTCALDEEVWQGTVRFLTAEEFPHTFERLQEDSAVILRCQKESRASFCTRFSPAKLLSDSGFATVLDTLRQHGP